MTENEAKTEIERHIQFLRVNWKPHPDYNVIEALGEAIQALEEIQALRAIGTVGEFKALKEKSEPKKPTGKYTQYKCSVCGRRVRSGNGSSCRVRDNFCQGCGTKLDWE